MSILSLRREDFVFDWETAAGRGLALAGFIVLSFVLHAVGFYLFQIVYPPAVSLLPPPARVSLITPNSEEGRTILRWLDAEDPALTSRTIRPPEMKGVTLPVVEHIPSYLVTEPALKDAPPLNIDLRMPSSEPAGPVVLPRARSEPSPQKFPTMIAFSSELQRLGAAALGSPKFIATSNDAPQAITFRIAVGDQGQILYCFAQSSSGDRDLDQQARSYLVLARFPPHPGQEPVWGSATIEWGTDVVTPRPAATETPLP